MVNLMQSLKDEIIEQLKTVYDPEIPINIYDIGLIYNIDIEDSENIKILMSLTSPFCPVAEELPEWVKEAVLNIDSINTCDVSITFDPEWGPHMMSEEAQAEMDMFSMNQPIYEYDYGMMHHQIEDKE